MFVVFWGGKAMDVRVWFVLLLLGSGFPAILRDRLYKTKAESLGLQPTFALSY